MQSALEAHFLFVECHFVMGLFGVLVVIFVGTSVFLTSARPTATKVIFFSFKYVNEEFSCSLLI
jgi:hypothetical protein